MVVRPSSPAAPLKVQQPYKAVIVTTSGLSVAIKRKHSCIYFVDSQGHTRLYSRADYDAGAGVDAVRFADTAVQHNGTAVNMARRRQRGAERC